MFKTVLSILAALSLTACAAQQGDTRSSAQRTLDTLNIAFIAAAVGVDTYAMLRPCGAGVPSPCSDLNLVTQLRQATVTVRAALDSAQRVVDTIASDATQQQKAFEIVREAMKALTTLMVQYGVAKG